ncbi:hypothetical protein N7470_005749 [Penicillium chermesinum]|nr:hypothetical protein N7470_005749 [Penicillium chermesinum]
MESLVLNTQVVSEKTLKEIVKGPLAHFTLNCDDSEKVHRLWQSLKITLSAPSLSNEHIGEACNAASAFLEAAAKSSTESTKQLALSTGTWLSTFEVFLARYEDFSPKPLKQLVGSLVTILAKNFPADKKAQIEEAIMQATLPSILLAARVFVLGLITHGSTRSLAGPCSGILENFLQKFRKQSPNEKASKFWVAPVRHVALHDLQDFEVLSTQVLPPIFTGDPEGFVQFVKTLPLESALTGDMAASNEPEIILLFVALQIGKKINLVHEDYDPSLTNKSKKPNPWNIVLKSEVIGKFLLHREPNIRVAALSLLITAFSTTKPMTSMATNAILRGLPSIHADSDSHSRSEIMGITRKFIVRLKSGIKDIDCLESTASAQKDSASEQLKSNEMTLAFLGEYVNFLQDDLCVTASYPRHISSLKALKLLLESGLDSLTDPSLAKGDGQGNWKVNMEIYGSCLLRLLLDLLLDPFEEVRQTSLAIINLFPSQILLSGGLRSAGQKPDVVMLLPEALCRAENIASNTSRADHADTVARLYHVLFSAAQSTDFIGDGQPWWATKFSVVNSLLLKLEGRLGASNGLFNSAMREASLHGYMSGLRYIILTPNFYSQISSSGNIAIWRETHERIVSICERIWEEVRSVLCVDSPEGHTDEPLEDISVGPKDILSYSWRALRESRTYGPSSDQGLKRADFEKLGTSSFTQLAELRHRGAFSTVSQTFATCCQRCSASKDPSIQELPHLWYQDAKSLIFESAGKLTRRSAGLPALVTGILASSPNSPFFKLAMEGLFEISRLSVDYDKEEQYLELPQVHAINCLKDVFTNTKIGPFTEPFIMSALTLSAERLGSPIWALRNSGLMLFRALLTRICRLTVGTKAGFGGPSGSEPGAKISFLKYPGLIELLSSLLAPSVGNTVYEGSDIVTERIFPALELIGEKIPTPDDNSDKVLRGLVVEHFSSPVWGIREHAARVYASLMARQDILQDIRRLLGLLGTGSSENLIHGVSLCFRYSLRRFAATGDAFWISQLDGILETIRLAFDTVFAFAKSPFVVTILIEVLNDTIDRSIKAAAERQVIKPINDIFDEHELHAALSYVFNSSEQGWNLTPVARSSSLLRRAFAWFLALKKVILQENDLHDTFLGVSQHDPDAAGWVCEQLRETLGEKERFHKQLAQLYTSIILGNHPADVKTTAVASLASLLEALLAAQVSLIKELDLPFESLLQNFQPEKDIETWNRHTTDGELRLRGSLLAIAAASNGASILHPDFKANIMGWVIKLRSALSEETEFTTRYAAVASVGSFIYVLRPEGTSARADPLFLELYLILYDMLNDDDEELRDLAASSASYVLSYSTVSPGAAVALGPLNASALLARFIMTQYSDSMHFARRLIRYLTGQEPRISGSDRQSQLTPVSELIAEYRQESTVLFVEEKQNLFIDEVREVDVWSQALLQLQRVAFPETLVRQISGWVSEGLEYLFSLFSRDSGKDGLLGWVSKPEAFTLGIRVITISSVLVSPQFSGSDFMDIDPHVLRVQLEKVGRIGRSASSDTILNTQIQKSPSFCLYLPSQVVYITLLHSTLPAQDNPNRQSSALIFIKYLVCTIPYISFLHFTVPESQNTPSDSFLSTLFNLLSPTSPIMYGNIVIGICLSILICAILAACIFYCWLRRRVNREVAKSNLNRRMMRDRLQHETDPQDLERALNEFNHLHDLPRYSRRGWIRPKRGYGNTIAMRFRDEPPNPSTFLGFEEEDSQMFAGSTSGLEINLDNTTLAIETGIMANRGARCQGKNGSSNGSPSSQKNGSGSTKGNAGWGGSNNNSKANAGWGGSNNNSKANAGWGGSNNNSKGKAGWGGFTKNSSAGWGGSNKNHDGNAANRSPERRSERGGHQRGSLPGRGECTKPQHAHTRRGSFAQLSENGAQNFGGILPGWIASSVQNPVSPPPAPSLGFGFKGNSKRHARASVNSWVGPGDDKAAW